MKDKRIEELSVINRQLETVVKDFIKNGIKIAKQEMKGENPEVSSAIVSLLLQSQPLLLPLKDEVGMNPEALKKHCDFILAQSAEEKDKTEAKKRRKKTAQLNGKKCLKN